MSIKENYHPNDMEYDIVLRLDNPKTIHTVDLCIEDINKWNTSKLEQMIYHNLEVLTGEELETLQTIIDKRYK